MSNKKFGEEKLSFDDRLYDNLSLSELSDLVFSNPLSETGKDKVRKIIKNKLKREYEYSSIKMQVIDGIVLNTFHSEDGNIITNLKKDYLNLKSTSDLLKLMAGAVVYEEKPAIIKVMWEEIIEKIEEMLEKNNGPVRSDVELGFKLLYISLDGEKIIQEVNYLREIRKLLKKYYQERN